MPQNGVYDLLKMLEIALDEGYSVLKYTVVNKREIEELIDRIYAALPTEVQEARLFLKRKEELQNEAQQKANEAKQAELKKQQAERQAKIEQQKKDAQARHQAAKDAIKAETDYWKSLKK